MALNEKQDTKKLNELQSDLSTAKRVHYAASAGPNGPPKGLRALADTPIPGGPVMGGGGSPKGSPQGNATQTWQPGVEGDTQLFTANRTDDDAGQVHHSIVSVINGIVEDKPDASYMELREAVKSSLQRQLTPSELNCLQDACMKKGKSDQDKQETLAEIQAAEEKANRASQLRELEGEHEEADDRRRIGVTEGEWDAEAAACHFCKKPFGLMRHRHHCRGCGRNVCDKDSPHKAVLPVECGYGSGPQRICAQCHSMLQFQMFQARAV